MTSLELAYWALAYFATSIILGPLIGKMIAYGTGDIPDAD